MTLKTICAGCGDFTDEPIKGRCPGCAEELKERDAARRRGKWQRRIWDDPRWRRCREFVWKRDGYRCRRCGRHRSELAPNERLIADHVDGLRRILDEGRNPFDPAECQTLCSTCSGAKDGGR